MVDAAPENVYIVYRMTYGCRRKLNSKTMTIKDQDIRSILLLSIALKKHGKHLCTYNPKIWANVFSSGHIKNKLNK